MKFTIVFGSGEDGDYSYGLCFVPCPVWVKGNEWILNIHPENPHYQLGDVGKLLEKEGIRNSITSECIILIHDIGNGTYKDLQVLQEDLRKEGFKVRVCSF